MLVLDPLTTGRGCVEDERDQVCALPSALSARALRLAWVCAHRLARAHPEALFCTCFAHVASSHTFCLPNLLSGATHHLKRRLPVALTLQGASIVRANGHCTQARGGATTLRATLQDAHHEQRTHLPTLGSLTAGRTLFLLAGRWQDAGRTLAGRWQELV